MKIYVRYLIKGPLENVRNFSVFDRLRYKQITRNKSKFLCVILTTKLKIFLITYFFIKLFGMIFISIFKQNERTKFSGEY